MVFDVFVAAALVFSFGFLLCLCEVLYKVCSFFRRMVDKAIEADMRK